MLFGYLAAVAPDLDLVPLYRAVRRPIPEAEELIMTLEQRLIQQGLQQGLEHGEKRGPRAVVQRTAGEELGLLGDDVLRRLEAAESRQLEQHAGRLLTASTLAEVLSGR